MENPRFEPQPKTCFECGREIGLGSHCRSCGPAPDAEQVRLGIRCDLSNAYTYRNKRKALVKRLLKEARRLKFVVGDREGAAAITRSYEFKAYRKQHGIGCRLVKAARARSAAYDAAQAQREAA